MSPPALLRVRLLYWSFGRSLIPPGCDVLPRTIGPLAPITLYLLSTIATSHVDDDCPRSLLFPSATIQLLLCCFVRVLWPFL